MRIHEWNPLQAYNKIQNGRLPSKQSGKTPERVSVQPETVLAQVSGDRLEISTEAQEKNHAASLSGQTVHQQTGELPASDVRQARLEALRQQIQAGTYEVSAEQVARKMLQAMYRRS